MAVDVYEAWHDSGTAEVYAFSVSQAQFGFGVATRTDEDDSIVFNTNGAIANRRRTDGQDPLGVVYSRSHRRRIRQEAIGEVKGRMGVWEDGRDPTLLPHSHTPTL